MGRKVYIKEFDCWGEEFEFILLCDNWNEFLSVWDIDTLQRLLKSSLEQENYEMAELINGNIKLKTDGIK